MSRHQSLLTLSILHIHLDDAHDPHFWTCIVGVKILCRPESRAYVTNQNVFPAIYVRRSKHLLNKDFRHRLLILFLVNKDSFITTPTARTEQQCNICPNFPAHQPHTISEIFWILKFWKDDFCLTQIPGNTYLETMGMKVELISTIKFEILKGQGKNWQ